MSKELNLEQILELCKEFSLEKNVIRTVIRVESSGSGYNSDGSLKIQFEPTWFSRYLDQYKIDHEFKKVLVNGKTEYSIIAGKKSVMNGVNVQSEEYRDYQDAIRIHELSAKLSTSYGMGQTMGFNYKVCGFKTVNDMITAYNVNEQNQVRGMLNFINSNKKMIAALITKDWATFAYYYNGESYKMYNYDTRLENEYSLLT